MKQSDEEDLSKQVGELHRYFMHRDLPHKKTHSRSIHFPGGIATRFAQADTEEYSGLVYNFQVEGDESYVVEDIAVHNCYICNEAIRQGGFQFTFGDEDQYAGGNMDDLLKELMGEEPTENTPDQPQGKASGNLVDPTERMLPDLGSIMGNDW